MKTTIYYCLTNFSSITVGDIRAHLQYDSHGEVYIAGNEF